MPEYQRLKIIRDALSPPRFVLDDREVTSGAKLLLEAVQWTIHGYEAQEPAVEVPVVADVTVYGPRPQGISLHLHARLGGWPILIRHREEMRFRWKDES